MDSRGIGAPELVEAVDSGEVTIGAAYKLAELPHEEQREVVAAGPDAVKADRAGRPALTALKPARGFPPLKTGWEERPAAHGTFPAGGSMPT